MVSIKFLEDVLVVWHGEKEPSTGSSKEKWLGIYNGLHNWNTVEKGIKEVNIQTNKINVGQYNKIFV